MLTAACLSHLLYFAAQLQYAIAGSQNPKQATCVAGKGTHSTALLTYGAIDIVCPDSTVFKEEKKKDENASTIFTSEKQDGVYVAPSTIVPGATCARKQDDAQSAQAILTVVQLPAERKSIVFVCEKKNNQGVPQPAEQGCIISVEIPASPPSGPNKCVIPKAKVRFHATNVQTIVRFSCGNHTLRPAQKEKALDSACQKEINIDSEIPGAAFKPAEKGQMAEFSLKQLPLKDKTLCYACDIDKSDACHVLIHITGSDNAVAVGISSRMASALSVILVAVALGGET